jgi:hypothetical protein
MLQRAIQAVCGIEAEDGMTFDAPSVQVNEIREEARYAGLRVRLVGTLRRARSKLQLDVGYGDVVTPGVSEVQYPTLLDDMPAPRLKVYPRETVFSEKLEAIASLGMVNSRMKDYFDLHALVQEGAIDIDVVGDAIAATFARRGTPLPDGLPIGLSAEFSRDAKKLEQWNAFVNKNRLAAPALEAVVADVGAFVTESLRRADERRRPWSRSRHT